MEGCEGEESEESEGAEEEVDARFACARRMGWECTHVSERFLECERKRRLYGCGCGWGDVRGLGL